MTRRYVNPLVCPACKHLFELPFNKWVRENPALGSGPYQAALSITDMDFIFHKYLVADKSTGRQLARQHMMLVELKTHSANVSMAQHDTLNVIHQMLHRGDKKIVNAERGRVKVFYHGLHLLQLSGKTPHDSRVIKWDRRVITIDILVSLLRFEVSARTLLPREDRLHHVQPPLLDNGWLDPGTLVSAGVNPDEAMAQG